MLDIQKLLDSMMDAAASDRSKYHLTLGGLIAALETASPETLVVYDTGGAPFEPDSYRGYYSDLAFATTPEDVTVSRLLAQAKESLGKTFEGYKGGDYTMTEETPLWHAHYGDCGPAIMGIAISDGKLVLITKDLAA